MITIIYKYIDGHISDLAFIFLIYLIVFTAFVFGLFNVFDNNNYYYHWMQLSPVSVSLFNCCCINRG